MQQIAELIYEQVCGTSQDTFTIIDYLIEDGEIDKAEYLANEDVILGMLDNMMFNCSKCGWNCEISELSISQSNM